MIVVLMCLIYNKFPLSSPRKLGSEGTSNIQEGQSPITHEEIPVEVQPEDNVEDSIEDDYDFIQSSSGAHSDGDPKEHTRGKMASIFILGFFLVIILCFVYAAWKQAAIDEVKDLVIAVIGALSGLIGFVIGYYFKTNN